MATCGSLVNLSHDHVDNRSITGVVSSEREVGVWVQSVLLRAEVRCSILTTQEVVTERNQASVEEELVVSYSAWQVLFLVDLVVVDSKTKVVGERLE